MGTESNIRLLLEEGADIEAKDKDGLTPLSWAAECGYEAVVKLLLEKDAEIEAKDSVGRTPLLYGAKNGNKATVQLLLATNRVDIDSIDYYNSTPLSMAARIGHTEVLVLLLTQSRGLNIKDIFGRTPLWWAKRTGHPEIVHILIEKCKENGIIVQENDLPTATISVRSDNCERECDVCLLGISEEDTYYYCEVCNGGDFDICRECFAIKAHCLDESHILISKYP
jgi:ankyrin repeat protein